MMTLPSTNIRPLLLMLAGLLSACGGSDDSGSENPDFSQPYYTTIRSISDDGAVEASRFADQATFGSNLYEINWLLDHEMDFSAWIAHQAALAPTLHQTLPHSAYQNGRMESWWKASVEAPDQLRQRMAYALSQIFVISDQTALIHNAPDATFSYYDMLVQQGLGNFRTLLESVTRHLTMGVFLSLKNSQKADPDSGAHPDENYAREVMQLFTIGLYQLNPDGSRQMAGGEPVSAYTQQDVEALARALTGWSSASQWQWKYDWALPMKAYDEYHDTGSKILLGQTVPAGQSAEEDLRDALDILFNHPNVGPFIARHLIQRFVTSNPAPDYIQRVAAAFDNNGSGIRGDLLAVIRAVLLDPEARKARTPGEAFGKMREPLMKQVHLWRAFELRPATYAYWNPENDFHQAPLRANSVFNFYSPDFAPSGDIQDGGLVAPEFQILTDASATSITNRMMVTSFGDFWNSIAALDTDLVDGLGDDVNAIVDHLDLVLLQGNMSAGMRSALVNHYLSQGDKPVTSRTRDLIYLISSSAEYAIQQ